MSRCNAVNGDGQCRCTKDLTRVLITIHREPHFNVTLPETAIVELCPRHFKLKPLERVLMNTPERTAQVKAAPGQAMNAARKARGLRPSGFARTPRT